MKLVKRSVCMMLVLSMITIGAVTGCAGKKVVEQKPSDQPAVVTEEKTEELEHVNLTWYVRGDEPVSGPEISKKTEAVYARINEILKDKINATLEMKFIPVGDYDQRMQMIMAAGEEYDIAWTADWANTYANNVSRGAYIPLNDLLENHPDLKALMPEVVWEGAKIGGKIYGVPSYQVMYNQHGLWFREDLVEKYKLGDKIEAATTLGDLTEVFQTIKDNEPNVYGLPFGRPDVWFAQFKPLVENLFAVDTETWKVHDIVENEDILNNYNIMREWYLKGFFPEDVGGKIDDGLLSREGRLFSRYARMKPGMEAETAQSRVYPVIGKETGEAILSGKSTVSSLNAISTTSKNPERAMSLLALVNTDKELYNLMVFGLEDEDYTKVGENHIEIKEGGYNYAAWMLGNQFNAYLTPGQPDTVWEETIQRNEQATKDPLLTFSFDRTPVETEMAQILAISREFSPILNSGIDEPDKVLKMRKEKMKAAGMDKVIEEIQRQIDEWRKTQ